MSKSRALKLRQKTIRQGKSDPSALRGMYLRKPQTQVVPNGKAKQRKSYCRSNGNDCAVSLHRGFAV